MKIDIDILNHMKASLEASKEELEDDINRVDTTIFQYEHLGLEEFPADLQGWAEAIARSRDKDLKGTTHEEN